MFPWPFSEFSKVSLGHIFHLPLVQGDLAPWKKKNDESASFSSLEMCFLLFFVVRGNLPNIPLIWVGEFVLFFFKPFFKDVFVDLCIHSEIYYGDNGDPMNYRMLRELPFYKSQRVYYQIYIYMYTENYLYPSIYCMLSFQVCVLGHDRMITYQLGPNTCETVLDLHVSL